MTEPNDEPIISVDEAYERGDLEKAVNKARLVLTQSKEWHTTIRIHAPLIVEAFSFGVLSADFWFDNYRVPPNLDKVTNWIAFNVQQKFPSDYAEITLFDLETYLMDWMLENPMVREWNPNYRVNDMTKKFYLSLKAIEQGERVAAKPRPFVELESITRNAAIMVKDYWKHRLQMREAWNR